LFLPVELLPGERVVRGILATRQHTLLSGALGQLYLTNRRLLWTPLRVNVWMRLVKEPQVVALSEIDRCEVGERSVFRGWPADVYANGSRYRFYVGALWGWVSHAMRGHTEEWVAAIRQAVKAAKEATE